MSVDIEEVLRIAELRVLDSVGLADTAGATKSLYNDTVGALAEAYFEYHSGEPWNRAIRNFDGPDVGKWHVRGADRHNKNLIVRPGDVRKHELHEPFVLVTVEGVVKSPIVGIRPDWTAIVQGWLPLGRCLEDDYKDDPGGRPTAWFVPADVLDPV